MTVRNVGEREGGVIESMGKATRGEFCSAWARPLEGRDFVEPKLYTTTSILRESNLKRVTGEDTFTNHCDTNTTQKIQNELFLLLYFKKISNIFSVFMFL